MAGAVIGAGGFAAVHPDVVKAFYQDIYPSDPAKSRALEVCFMQDHKFNRLDAGERELCYRHVLSTVGEVPGEGAAESEINPIDLQRAASEGSLRGNDIRRAEQTEKVAHNPH
jgi:hypothetical protein